MRHDCVTIHLFVSYPVKIRFTPRSSNHTYLEEPEKEKVCLFPWTQNEELTVGMYRTELNATCGLHIRYPAYHIFTLQFITGKITVMK